MADIRAILSSGGSAKRPGAHMVIREAEFQRFRLGLAFGALNAAFAVEKASKELTPVHGDPDQGGKFSTFAPGVKPIGGTLRRSQHSVAYLDGVKIGGATVDENGANVPSWVPAGGIAAVVGTNVDYAVYVHDGTVRMPARPFLAEAMAAKSSRIPELIVAGTRRYLRLAGGSR